MLTKIQEKHEKSKSTTTTNNGRRRETKVGWTENRKLYKKSENTVHIFHYVGIFF